MNTQREVRSLIDTLNRWRYEYYTLNAPSVSDAEYDANLDRLAEMERMTGIIYPDSPTQKIGADPIGLLAEVRHDIPLLSLAKTKSADELTKFADGREVIITAKMDGLTTELSYTNGILRLASTRGDGSKGNDVTENAKTIRNIPIRIPYDEPITIVGETHITWEDFHAVCASEKTDFKTPRNLAGATLMQPHSDLCRRRRLSFVPFDIISGTNFAKMTDTFRFLSDIGFTPIIGGIAPINQTLKESAENIRRLAHEKGIPIDGVVVRYNDILYGSSLGNTAHHPRHSIAYKFEDERKTTTVTDIEWNLGRTGIVVPVAIFDTVVLDGTDVSRASLHSVSNVEKIGIAPGDTIEVEKSNRIIPNVVRVTEHKGSLVVPDCCPSCFSLLVRVGKHLMCKNALCPSVLTQSILHFAGSGGLRIKGFGQSMTEDLVKRGIITKRSDIFTFTNDTIRMVGAGYSQNKIRNIASAVTSAAEKVTLAGFILAYGIPNVGTDAVRAIEKQCVTASMLKSMVDDGYDFSLLPGVDHAAAESIQEFFSDKKQADDFWECVHFLPRIRTIRIGDALDGLHFLIYGKYAFGEKTETVEMIEQYGGITHDYQSKKTNYVVISDKSGFFAGIESFNIPVVTVSDVAAMIEEKTKCSIAHSV